MPEASIDPVVMAASTVMRLQTIVSREVAPTDSAVVTIGVLQAGTKENVIPKKRSSNSMCRPPLMKASANMCLRRLSEL